MSANAGYVTIGVIANTSGLAQSFGNARRIVAQESTAIGRTLEGSLNRSIAGAATLQQVDRVSGTMKQLFRNVGLAWAADAADMVGDLASAFNMLGGKPAATAASGIYAVRAASIGATKSLQELWKQAALTPSRPELEWGQMPPSGKLLNRPIPLGTGSALGAAGRGLMGVGRLSPYLILAAAAAATAGEWRGQQASTNTLAGRVGESTETEKLADLRRRFSEEGIALDERAILAVQAKNREERRLSMETQARTSESIATVDALQARQRRNVRAFAGDSIGGGLEFLFKWTGISRAAANIGSWIGQGERLIGERDPIRGRTNRFGPVRAIRKGESGVAEAIAEAMGARSAASESAEARELREANKRLRAIETNTKPQLLGIN